MGSDRNVLRKPHLARLVSRFLRKERRAAGPKGSALFTLRDLARAHSWNAYLFGGVPRGFWLHGIHSRIRDFDIVFDDAAFEEFESRFRGHIVKRNRFGGLKILIDRTCLDVWPLSSTWAFREGLVHPVEFSALPRTTFLNVDSLVVELAPQPGKRRKVYEQGFFQAYRTALLDICLEDNPYPALCVVRSFKLAECYGLSLSGRLCRYILDFCQSGGASQIETAQKKHYGRIIYSFADFHRIIAAMENAIAGSVAIAPFPKPPTQMEIWSDLFFSRSGLSDYHSLSMAGIISPPDRKESGMIPLGSVSDETSRNLQLVGA